MSISAIGFGFSPFLATRVFAEGVGPFTASFIRVAAMALLLAPWATRVAPWRREAVIVAVGGALSMLGFAGYFVALERAPVAAATVVYYTYPVVVLALSALVWRRPPSGRQLTIGLAVVAGVALAVGPTGWSSGSLGALAPAFAAPIGWGVYLLVLSGPAARMPLLPKVFTGACGGATVLLPLALRETGGGLPPLHPGAVGALAVMTLCTLAIPALMVTWGAARAGEQATAMIGSLEFAVAVGVGWLMMDEAVTVVQWVGVAVVLAAAGAAARESNRASSTTPPRPPAPGTRPSGHTTTTAATTTTPTDAALATITPTDTALATITPTDTALATITPTDTFPTAGIATTTIA